MTPIRDATPRRRSGRLVALAAALLAISVGCIARAEASPSFAAANRAFAERQYPVAVARFEELARTRGWSAPLLYDLANAYAQEGNIGRAILGYERARWLAPRNSDVAANLALVRKSAGLTTSASPWHQRAAHVLSAATWTVLAGCSLWLAGIGLAAARRRRSRRLGYAAAIVALAGAISIAAVAVLDRTLDDAVVVAHKSASLRLSPFDTAAVEATVGEGDEVAVIGRHGDFVRVRDGQGRAGWVESAAVQLIVPRSS